MIVTVEGKSHFGTTPRSYIEDMLRYDKGEILFMLEEGEGENFLTVIQCERFTELRWNSFGLTVQKSYHNFPIYTDITCYTDILC